MALHVMDEANHCLGCKVPRCQQGCPIHTNIPEVIRLLKDNKLDEAGRMLFENNPLTTVCSLVCNHEKQCEGHCVRGIKGAPVHFSVIENYISSTYASQMTQGPCTTITDSTKDLKTTPRGLFETDEVGRTSIPGIFASGDAVKGARTVVEAVAYSKNVAEAMHEYMQTLPPDLPDEYANVPVAEYGEGN